MEYSNYQIYDFVTDPYFRKWVLDPDEDTKSYWTQWVALHPEKEAVVRQAAILVKATDFNEINASEEDFYGTKQKIKQQLFKESNELNKWLNPSPEKKKSSFSSRLKLAAAISAILLVSIYLVKTLTNDGKEYITDYGEVMTFSLPDRSTVTLNANSYLRVAENWQTDREVWLEGEAFFEVEKKVSHHDSGTGKFRKFTVHAGKVDIEVIGTRFNVQERREKTQVFLEEGLVALKGKERPDHTIRLSAGEAVSYSNEEDKFSKEKISPVSALAWRQSMHIFDATPLIKIAEILEDTYGLEVMIQDADLKKYRFSTEVPYGEVDLLCMLIAESMKIEVVKNGNTIVIQKIK